MAKETTTAKKSDSKAADNLLIYEQARTVPQYALKEIKAGRLKGMTDINPMFRIKRMTELFGPCGIGWKYEITRQWFESYGEEVKAFTNINLYYKLNGEWSEAIPGTGGSSFVAKEKSGAYVNDECVDGDCEVLTPNGWIKFSEYNGEDEVCQFDSKTAQLSFVKPIRFIKNTSSNVIDKGGILMTANHRVLCYNRNKKRNVVKFANNLLGLVYKKSRSGYGRSGCFRDIKCGFYGEPKQLTTLQKIGIMIACDGALYRTNTDGTIYWRCEFTKERKIIKAKSLLDAHGIKYKEDIFSRTFGETTALVFKLENNTNYKDYRNFIPLGNYPELWDEIVSWDGCRCDHEQFSTTKKESAMYLQTLFALSGSEVVVYFRERECKNHSPIYALYKKKNHTSMVGARRVEGTYDMYCVEVPTSFFLIRKGADILVTGNCLKMALTDAISVATKALGIAADIYYAKDGKALNPGDSKYQELTNEPQKNKSDFDRLRAKYPNIFAAQTVDELMAIYQSNAQNVNDSDFMLALSARKKEVGG